MSFTPILNYPKTLMLTETYHFDAIQATCEGYEIAKIEAKWLNGQPPKEMGYFPIQIKVVATTGEVYEETVEIFAYTKPFDGHRKFIIFTYQGVVKMVTFDCNNHSSNALYMQKDTGGKLYELGYQNGYIGHLGYVFDEEKKEWIYEKTLVGRYSNKLGQQPSADSILYSNIRVYKANKSTILYEADPVKEDLPYWTPAVKHRHNYEYQSPLEFDPTIEAYYVVYGRFSTDLCLQAYCFKGLNGEPAQVTYRASGSSSSPYVEHSPATMSCTVLTKDVNDPSSTWQVSYYNNTRPSNLPNLGVVNDAVYGYTEVMNTLHEVYNVDFVVCDNKYENGYTVVDHKKATPTPETPEMSPESVREAKYRMKNDATGDYDTIHFETNVEQIVGFSEKHNELTSTLANQYNKAETIQLFDLAHNEVSEVELMTNALNDRLIAVNQEQEQVAFDLTNEVVRATTTEAHLQDQLDQLSNTLTTLPNQVLTQSKTYTDEKVSEVRETLDELSNQLGGQSSDLVTRLDEIETTINHHHEAFGETTTQLNAKLDVEDGRVSALELEVGNLQTTDQELDSEIAKLKQHLLNKGNDTLVFATQEQFENAVLTPKTGDLVYILETKKCYICSNGSFILFDEITTTDDIKDYILRTDVVDSMTNIESLLNTEVERATTEEGQLGSHLQGVADIDTLQGQAIGVLEQTTTEHQSSINELSETRYKQAEVEAIVNAEVEKQMAIFSPVEPEHGRCGHIWLEEMAD